MRYGDAALTTMSSWHADQMANRLEARERIVADFMQMWIDDERRRRDQQGVAIRRGARHAFGADHCARARTVFDHHGGPMRAGDLFAQQAGQDVRSTARRIRDDHPDRPRRLLRPDIVTAQRWQQSYDTNGEEPSERNHPAHSKPWRQCRVWVFVVRRTGRCALALLRLDAGSIHQIADGGHFGGQARGKLFGRAGDDLEAGLTGLFVGIGAIEGGAAFLHQHRHDGRWGMRPARTAR